MPQQAPLLRVVRGDPTAGELAALVAIVVARRAAAAVVSPAIRRSGWSERNRLLRVTHPPGPAGWRASAAPR